jgi:hypothetical protein
MAQVNNQIVTMKFPIQPKLRYKFTFEGELNISPYVAKQKANYYLVMHVGNLVMAADPNLEFHESGAQWRVPAILTNPEIGHVGKIGEVIVDADTGSIIENETTSVEEMQANAEHIAKEEALSPPDTHIIQKLNWQAPAAD